MVSVKIANKQSSFVGSVNMRFLLISICLTGPALAVPVLKLKEGRVKTALKKHYRIHLAQNFQAEAEKELQKKLSRPKS